MKKIFLLSITLCLAHVCFAQLKVNSVGNAGIGVTPNTKAKLMLNSSSAVTDTVFGLHSTANTTNNGANKPLYGVYSTNTSNNAGHGSMLYGAYFKNKLYTGSNSVVQLTESL